MIQSLSGRHSIVESPCRTVHYPLHRDQLSLPLGNDASQDDFYDESAQDGKARLGVVKTWGLLPEMHLRHVPRPTVIKESDFEDISICEAVRTDPAAILILVQLLVRGHAITSLAAPVFISFVPDVVSVLPRSIASSGASTPATSASRLVAATATPNRVII